MVVYQGIVDNISFFQNKKFVYGFFLVHLLMWDRHVCDFEGKDSACKATGLLENLNLLPLSLWWPFHKVISKVTYVHSVSTLVLVIYFHNFFVCVCVLCVVCVLTSNAGHRLSYSLPWLKQRSLKWKKQSGNFQVLLWTTFFCLRLTLVVELIRKTNADRFRRFDDILSSLSRKWRKFTEIRR